MTYGDDRSIFLGLKFLIPGYFWEGKFDKYFWGGLILVGIFLGIQNNLKIRGSARVSQPRSSVNKVQPNLFCVNKFNALDNYIVSVS